MLSLCIPKYDSRSLPKNKTRTFVGNRGYLREEGFIKTNKETFDYGADSNIILICFLGYIGIEFFNEQRVIGSTSPNHRTPSHGMKKG